MKYDGWRLLPKAELFIEDFPDEDITVTFARLMKFRFDSGAKYKESKMGLLTNRDIATKYSGTLFYVSKKDFVGAFAFWVVSQSPGPVMNLDKMVADFSKYLDSSLPMKEGVSLISPLTQSAINELVSEEALAGIPSIRALNYKHQSVKKSPKNTLQKQNDFIDLGALARNVSYTVMREYITQN